MNDEKSHAAHAISRLMNQHGNRGGLGQFGSQALQYKPCQSRFQQEKPMPASAEQFSQLRIFPLTTERPIYMNMGELLYAEEIVFLHWHDCFEFALCLEGNAVFDIAGQGVQAVKPGDIYFIVT